MKTQVVRFFGIFAVVGALLVTLSSASVAAQSGGMRDASFDAVTFRYDASLAAGVEPRIMPETVESADVPWWLAQPRHMEFNFKDFHGSTQSLPPAIYIYPVRSDYTSLTQVQGRDVWSPSVRWLKDLLARQPDPHSIVEQSSTSPNALPETALLPPINAATVFVGKPAYLTFRNGMGLRFLVQTSQDVSPPDRDNTSYTFQGLTSDGKYYVAAIFPAFPIAMQPFDVFQGNDIGAYYRNVRARMDGISNDAYTPNLELLDKMIGSLSVHPTTITVLPGMPGTGDGMARSVTLGLATVAGMMLLAGGVLALRRSKQTS